ncbi:MAG: hypothetical protein OXE86_17930 [Alphaproteobacteria bacterium]|nr:hypothetical protein [Alphaproteobacteria bacterium]
MTAALGASKGERTKRRVGYRSEGAVLRTVMLAPRNSPSVAGFRAA